jgi:CRISPR-associated protein Cas1
MIVYITEQGAYITIAGERIVIRKNGSIVGTFLSKDLDQIVIMGNISITTQAMKHLLKNKIDTVFTTYSGKYLGRLVAELGKNVVLRRLQFETLTDENIKLSLARSIIESKVKNCIQTLRKFNYYHKSGEVSKILNQLTASLKENDKIDNISSLLGFEGRTANLYFQAFDHLLKGPIFFEKRTRRPPQNEFNAMLSFGYTILLNLVRTSVNTVGMDPYYGAYHAEEYGRPSLVLDLMEEFRPVAVDFPVISSVNKNIMQKSDFVWNTDGDPDKLPVQLTVFGRKKFISLLEKRFNQKFWHDTKMRNMKLREIIRYQCYLFSKSLVDKVDYKGFRVSL